MVGREGKSSCEWKKFPLPKDRVFFTVVKSGKRFFENSLERPERKKRPRLQLAFTEKVRSLVLFPGSLIVNGAFCGSNRAFRTAARSGLPDDQRYGSVGRWGRGSVGCNRSPERGTQSP